MKYTYMMIPGLNSSTRESLDGVFSTEKYERVIELVAEIVGIKYETMKGKTRIREVVEARNISMFLIKDKYPTISLKQIGSLFNRDHTTVIHALKNVKVLNDVDFNFRKKLEKSHRNVFIYSEK